MKYLLFSECVNFDTKTLVLKNSVFICSEDEFAEIYNEFLDCEGFNFLLKPFWEIKEVIGSERLELLEEQLSFIENKLKRKNRKYDIISKMKMVIKQFQENSKPLIITGD